MLDRGRHNPPPPDPNEGGANRILQFVEDRGCDGRGAADGGRVRF